MELTKEISYDKNLIQNSKFTLKYSGELFKNNSEDVFIVYGYDKDWKNTAEQKMEKQNDCFSATIQIQEFNEFNFCFRNSSNIWDNNNTSDYHLPIIEQENIEINSELNELLDKILNEVKTPTKIEIQDTDSDFKQTVSYFENLFDELFNTQETIEESSAKQSISYYEKLFDELFSTQETIEESSAKQSISYYEKLFDELFSTQETISKSSAEQNISYYEKLFDELFASSKQSQELNTNLDLVDTFPEEFELQQSVSKVEIKEEKQEKVATNKTLALTTTSKRKSIFEFENLSPLYVLGKRLRLAFYKLIYVLPAFLFGEEEDSEN